MNALANVKATTDALQTFVPLLDWYVESFEWRRVGEASELIPRAALPAVIDSCRAALVPVQDPKAAAGAVAMLFAPYRRADFENPKLAAQLFAQTAGGYPPDVLRAAIQQVHATLKFVPSIAEFRTALDAAMAPHHRRLNVAQAMEREHVRRDREAADRAREEATQREWIARKERHFLIVFGTSAPSPGDYQIAARMFRGNSHFSEFWNAEMDAGKRWAADLTRALAVMGMAKSLADALKIDIRQACAIAAKARKDHAAARAMIADVEAGRTICGTHRPDEEANWRLFYDQAQFLIDESCKVARYNARTDFTCAVEELRMGGAGAEEIANFVQALMDNEPAALARQSQLAADNRIRPMPDEREF